MCSLFSVKVKSIKSLSSAKVFNNQTLFLRFQISWTRMCSCFCLRLVSYRILWILAQMLLFHSIILCQELLRRATQTDKLPCRWLRPWVNRDEDTVASYLSAVRVLSVELRNWIDWDEQRYDWRRCKHHNQHPIRTREINICILVLVTAGNDGVFCSCFVQKLLSGYLVPQH